VSGTLFYGYPFFVVNPPPTHHAFPKTRWWGKGVYYEIDCSVSGGSV